MQFFIHGKFFCQKYKFTYLLISSADFFWNGRINHLFNVSHRLIGNKGNY